MAVLERESKLAVDRRRRHLSDDRRCSDAEADRRIDAVLQEEIITGVPIRVAEAPRSIRTQIMLPIGPFRAWLVALIDRELRLDGKRDPKKVIAKRLGVTDRRIRAYLYELDEIDEATVDKAFSREGSTTLAEHYPYGVDTVSAPSGQANTAPARKGCATPDCGSRERLFVAGAKHVDISSFCPPCSLRLKTVRVGYKADSEAFRLRIGKKDAQPMCCNRACFNPRDGLAAERFCTACQEEGFSEDDYS